MNKSCDLDTRSELHTVIPSLVDCETPVRIGIQYNVQHMELLGLSYSLCYSKADPCLAGRCCSSRFVPSRKASWVP